MNNYLDDIFFAQKYLKKLKYPSAYRVAREIVDYTNGNKRKLKRVLNDLEGGKPWEYIRGWTQFCGLKILVNENVLIPRVETEKIVEIIRANNLDNVDEIIDVGSGSGAIAIAVKKEFPKKKIIGIDISEKALSVAKKNARINDVKIKWINSDLLSKYNSNSPALLVANLPYIPTNKYGTLDKSVKDFEPKIALCGGRDGLRIINRLIKQIRERDNIKTAVFEIDSKQEKALRKKYNPTFYKDIFGLTRFFKIDIES